MSQVMVIPGQRKIFMREYSNGMYTTRVFFLVNWCMSIILSISYPIITSAISFSFLGFEDDSAGNYFTWLTILLIQTLSGQSFGFMMGTIMDNELSALMVCQLLIVIMNFGSGFFINNNTDNVFVIFLSKISPFRYASEVMMRCFLKEKPQQDQILNSFDFTLGTAGCIGMSILFLICFFILSWLSITYKARLLFR